MKKILLCLLLLVAAGCTTGKETSGKENVTVDSAEDQNMRVYDEEGVKRFLEHGSGVLLLKDSDSETVEEIADIADDYGITVSCFEVKNPEDKDLIFLINSHNINRMRILGNTIRTPLLLFVEDGMIHNVITADDFDFDGWEETVGEYMEASADYLKKSDKDACDSGCKLG